MQTKTLCEYKLVGQFDYINPTTKKKCVCLAFDADAQEEIDDFHYEDFINDVCSAKEAKVYNVARCGIEEYNDARTKPAAALHKNRNILMVDLEYDFQPPKNDGGK